MNELGNLSHFIAHSQLQNASLKQPKDAQQETYFTKENPAHKSSLLQQCPKLNIADWYILETPDSIPHSSGFRFAVKSPNLCISYETSTKHI
jgi:hypothetical protein